MRIENLSDDEEGDGAEDEESEEMHLHITPIGRLTPADRNT